MLKFMVSSARTWIYSINPKMPPYFSMLNSRFLESYAKILLKSCRLMTWERGFLWKNNWRNQEFTIMFQKRVKQERHSTTSVYSPNTTTKPIKRSYTITNKSLICFLNEQSFFLSLKNCLLSNNLVFESTQKTNTLEKIKLDPVRH